MVDDIVLNKVATIERCVARIQEVHAGQEEHLTEDFTKQDSIVLNLQRACEASIDLAMHIVRMRRLGVPQDSRSAFELLQSGSVLNRELSEQMQHMVGFRNIAVHDYTNLNLAIVHAIITDHLSDFLAFTKKMLSLRQA